MPILEDDPEEEDDPSLLFISSILHSDQTIIVATHHPPVPTNSEEKGMRETVWFGLLIVQPKLPDHPTPCNMSDQQQKKRGLPSSSPFPIPSQRRRPPAPINAAQLDASGALPSSCANTPPGVHTSPGFVVGSSKTSSHIDGLQTVSRRPDQNTPSVSMFSDIEQVHIRRGEFNQNIYNVNTQNDNLLKLVALQSLPLSRDAAFSAAITLDNLARRPCTKGTRVDIITKIMAWVTEKDRAKAPPVYWLTGLAGLGKTTIAYTICEQLNEARLPFVSFFCSLQLDSSDSKLLVPTLCRQLSVLYDSYADNLLSVMEKNVNAVHAGLRIQIDELLAKPWQASVAQQNYHDIQTSIFVVDALDESDHGAQFLEELLRLIHAGQLVGMKFLVTSRQAPEIVDICKSFPPDAVYKLHEVKLADVQNDIEIYLREALPDLQDEPELALLSQRAGGFFIYAATAVRFISPRHNPPSVSEMRSYLRGMVDPEQLRSDSDERLLVDELYERILGKVFCDARARASRLPILHTIVCAESGLKMSVLADLTKTEQDTVKRVVESLHAVLFVSPKDGCVYWYHASFPDFVFSQTRAQISISHHPYNFPVFCHATDHHRVLARQCFCLMQGFLHFNMCNLPSSYLFDSEVPDLNTSVDKTFTPTLRYVSRHWAWHLRHAWPAKNDDDELLCGLKNFLFEKLLFWMEAMNLLGAKSECASSLKDAESWLEKGKKWPDLLNQLAGATSFSLFFAGSEASKSTPHLYITALSMWNLNQDLPLWAHWRGRFGSVPSIVTARGAITIPLLTISTSYVTSIAISPDGNWIVADSGDNSVRVWDAKTGELSKELQGHTDHVTSVSFSPVGNRIVSGSNDTSVRVWDAKTGEQLRKLQGHTGRVNSVSFSRDDNRIISGSADNSVRVWDAKTGDQLRELQHPNSVNSVAFSPDGNRIVSGSRGNSVWLWDAKTGKLLRELRGHIDAVSSVLFSPDGNQIVSGSHDYSLLVWDAKTGEQLKRLQGRDSHVASVSFSPDGNRIVSGSGDHSVRVWDAKAGKLLRELHGHTNGINSVSFSPDGDPLFPGPYENSVLVWDAKTGEQLKRLRGRNAHVASVSFSPDGNRIVSGSGDHSVRVWDVKTGELLRELQGHTFRVSSVSFSPDGNRIISGSNDSVLVWDAKTGEQLKRLQGHNIHVNSVSFLPDGNRILSGSVAGGRSRELQGHTDMIASVSFSPDDNRIISGPYDKLVRVWNAMMGEQPRKLQGHTHTVRSVSFSPDGNQIVSGSYDKSVRVWDAKTGQQLRELQGHTQVVASVSFSPGGHRIASGSYDNSVRLWDAKTGEQLRVLLGHTDMVASVSFSPGGNQIASGSYDNSVRVWDAQTGKQLRELQGHTRTVKSVSFSPDGNRLISGSYDESVRVWDVKTGEQLRVLQGHTLLVISVSFSPDGNQIVSGSDDKSVRVWDAKTGEQSRVLLGHSHAVTSVSFSPDGNRIVSGSYDNSVRVWANLNLDPLWVLDRDGWIVSGPKRLVWVPPTVRNVLLRPHNMLIISRNGSASISFTLRKLGLFWHECYTP